MVWSPAGPRSEESLSRPRIAVDKGHRFELHDIPSGTVDLALLRSRNGAPISWRRGVRVPEDADTVTIPDWEIQADLTPLNFTIAYPEGVDPIATVRLDSDYVIVKGRSFRGWAPAAGARLAVSCAGCQTYIGTD